MDDPQLNEVYAAANSQHAHLVKAALERAGIPARVVGDSLRNAAGDLPLGLPIAPRVWVQAKDSERARALIEEWDRGRGASVGAVTEAPWTCPECGETVEGDFEVCWNCEHDRVGDSTH